jgi:hypothetical protein
MEFPIAINLLLWGYTMYLLWKKWKQLQKKERNAAKILPKSGHKVRLIENISDFHLHDAKVDILCGGACKRRCVIKFTIFASIRGNTMS